jgi:hypothetical protein
MFYYVGGDETFRANFLGSVTTTGPGGVQYTTLVVNCYVGNDAEEDLTIHYIDSLIIARFETLYDIMKDVKSTAAIPEEVFLEIDKFWR